MEKPKLELATSFNWRYFMTAHRTSVDRANEGKSVCVTNPTEVTHCVLQPKVSGVLVMTFANLSGHE